MKKKLIAFVLLTFLIVSLCSCENTESTAKKGEETFIPVLMFHHFQDESNGSTIITYEQFSRQMKLIADNGYNAITVSDMINYVEKGIRLPEKPLLITFDDGYRSNYDFVYPTLKEYGLKGTVFIIGFSVGKTTYKNTDNPITPHFTWEQAKEMEDSGVIQIESHSYDMHQWPLFEEQSPVRNVIAKTDGESDKHFTEVISSDIEYFNILFNENLNKSISAMAYPGGVYDGLSEEAIHNSGIKVTFTTEDDKINLIQVGNTASLYALGRHNITDKTTDEALLQLLTNNSQK